MPMRKPGWRAVVTTLVGVAALSLIAVRPHAAPANRALPSGSPTATAQRPTSASPPPSAGPVAQTSSGPTCASVVAGLSPRRQLAQLLMVGVDPAALGNALTMVRTEQVGGLFIGGSAANDLVSGRLNTLRAAATLPLFVAIDEEGGRVQRITGPGWTLPSARTMAATMTMPQVAAAGHRLGEQLRAVGVNVDFAPDTDVSSQPANAVIGDRSFSADPAVVTGYAGAFASGLRDSGVLPVLKHFPGHGHAVGDSHTGPAVTPPLSALTGDDLVPYRTLPEAGPTAIMVGHLEVPGLTGGIPASLSPAAYQLLRDDYHFNGVAFTDDLGTMAAVTAKYGLPQAVQIAITSGADVALWANSGQVGAVLDQLSAALASGALPAARVNEAVTRVLIAKGVCGH